MLLKRKKKSQKKPYQFDYDEMLYILQMGPSYEMVELRHIHIDYDKTLTRMMMRHIQK